MAEIDRQQSFDSDELADALVGWSQAYTQIGRGRLEAELLQVMLPDASLIYERSNLHLHENMIPPKDQVVIALPLEVTREPLCNASPIALNSLLLLRGGEEVEICAPGEFRTIALCLQRRLLTDTLGEQDQECLERALDKRQLSIPQYIARDLGATLLGALGAFECGNLKISDPRHAKRTTTDALNRVMQAIDDATLNDSNGVPRSLQQRRRLVLTAIEFMQADLALPLSLPELSKTLNISQRTLHYCFRQICQTSPHQYFLCLRLAEARRRLKLDPQQNITVLALELGFYSSSHFSSQYKRQFAEQPSLFARLQA